MRTPEKRFLASVVVVLLAGVSQTVAAQTKVVFCERCSKSAEFRAALSGADGPGRVRVGDRNNLHKGGANHIGLEIRLPGLEKGVAAARSLPQVRTYLSLGSAPPLGLNGKNLSGFDIVKDGPFRQSFLAWASDTSNWPNWHEPAKFYAKMIVSTGKTLYTGSDFQITATFVFTDGSYALTRYYSKTQSLRVGEVRDSVGNLIYTSSSEQVPMAYTSDMWPGAFMRRDYARGADLLWRRGAMTSDGRIRTGTVIVKDAVVVRSAR